MSSFSGPQIIYRVFRTVVLCFFGRVFSDRIIICDMFFFGIGFFRATKCYAYVFFGMRGFSDRSRGCGTDMLCFRNTVCFFGGAICFLGGAICLFCDNICFLGAQYVFWGARYVFFATTYVFWERNIFWGGAICFFCDNLCFFRSAAFVFGIQPVLQICLFSKCTGSQTKANSNCASSPSPTARHLNIPRPVATTPHASSPT